MRARRDVAPVPFLTYQAENLRDVTRRPGCATEIELACAEASRAFATGHRGVQIGNHVGPKDLDDSLVRFLVHCANEGIPVLVHPWDMMTDGRMKKWILP